MEVEKPKKSKGIKSSLQSDIMNLDFTSESVSKW